MHMQIIMQTYCLEIQYIFHFYGVAFAFRNPFCKSLGSAVPLLSDAAQHRHVVSVWTLWAQLIGTSLQQWLRKYIIIYSKQKAYEM